MIRRAFWLGAGAAAGILSYRRVSALGARISGPLARTELRRSRGGVLTATRATTRFARDVREGMDMYMSRHPVPDALPSVHGTAQLPAAAGRAAERGTAQRGPAEPSYDRKDGR